MKTIDKKASIQLSLGFLITLIISLVIFILSIGFLTDFWKGVDELKTSLDQQTQAEIEKLLAGNARIAIPLDTQTTKPSKAVVYGVGIRNTLTTTSYEYFKVNMHNMGLFIPVEAQNDDYMLSCSDMKCSIQDGYDGQGYNDLADPNVISYLVGRDGDMNIKLNRQDTVGVAIMPNGDAPRGHYIFNIEVCAGNMAAMTCSQSNYYGDMPTPSKIHMIVK